MQKSETIYGTDRTIVADLRWRCPNWPKSAKLHTFCMSIDLDPKGRN